tara:strand:- start:39071 stop:40285 length:1215 start_codon:yes stop_codon:yes gene_type:complete
MTDKINSKKNLHFTTKVIHAGQEVCPATGAIMPPIYTTSTYKQQEPGVHQGFEYSRAQNPTRLAYEKCIAELESGTHSFAFASGLAAIDSIIDVLEPGSHVIAIDDLYGGTYRLFTDIKQKKSNLEFSFIDFSDLNNIELAIKDNTRMIWIESPTNPLLKIVDLEQVIKIINKINNQNNSENKIITVVDNTFATPFIQRPLELGFDIVMHSATKYINGHADIIGGIAIVDAEKNLKIKNQLEFYQYAVGAIQGPFESYLALRGLKTLAVRMQRHCENAMYIAENLLNNKHIKKIYYPGLKNHSTYHIAKKQMNGFYGGIISIELDCSYNQVKIFLSNLKIFTLAESLGGVESLVNHPAIMTHATVPKKKREALGITDSLLRLSVGIENKDDLLQDILQALNKIN